MERNEITYHQSPRFILRSNNIRKYAEILVREHKLMGDEETKSPLLVILDSFTTASEKETQIRTFTLDEPGVDYLNWYLGLHKTFTEVMLNDKFQIYQLGEYSIYIYNKLLMIEGRIYTLDQIKGLIDHYTMHNIVQAPIELIRDMSAFRIGCLTVSVQNITDLVEFAEKGREV